MRISVIIPCHNAAPYIAGALTSAADQAYAPHEIIVINDASTDETDEAVKGAGVDVQLIHTKHHNAAAARNAGIDIATGDWIAYLDSDDIWYPHHLKQAVSVLTGSDDVAYLAHYEALDRDGQVVLAVQPTGLDKLTTGLHHHEYVRRCLAHNYFCHDGVLQRRDRIMAVGGFDAGLVRRHDFELFMRVIRDGTWSYDPRPASRVRRFTPDAISRNRASRQYFFLRAALQVREGYDIPEMSRVIQTGAGTAMAAAYMYGDAQDRARAKGLAWPCLSPAHKALFTGAALCPPLVKGLIFFRRLLKGRGGDQG